jgi:hypothetical protein
MAPGIAITVIFVDRVSKAVTEPGFGSFAAVAALAAVVVAAALYIHRRFAGAAAPATERI